MVAIELVSFGYSAKGRGVPCLSAQVGLSPFSLDPARLTNGVAGRGLGQNAVASALPCPYDENVGH